MSNQSSSWRRYFMFIVLVCIAMLIVIVGLVSRWSRAEQLNTDAEAQAIRIVAIIKPSIVPPTALELPGRIEAWARAPIYARVSGYLKNWKVDIGQHVKSGELLAEIEVPDLDHQLQQAKSELARGKSELSQYAATAKRWQTLLASNTVSRQEAEEKMSTFNAQQAQVNALQANLDRTQALQQYSRLLSPFDGVVTERNAEVGSLINVGMSAGSELFVISDIQKLRVYVDVPQQQISSIVHGTQATISVPEHPGQTFRATVQSMSHAIDRVSGAMRTQLVIDNPDGKLVPGAFATVHFESQAEGKHLGLPPTALIFNKEGVQVAVMDEHDRVRLQKVVITRDLGNIVEIAGGLSQNERIINSPPDGIDADDLVREAIAQQEDNK